MQVNNERLAKEFTALCEIESPSKKEGAVSHYLQDTFRRLGADEQLVDESSVQTGSETGNLIMRFNGKKERAPIFFCCHMDTVGPTEGIQVKRAGNTFTSLGETVLGADDKSGIAALIELAAILQERDIDHYPFEMVFTTCEEIGLLGAKAFDPANLRSKYGYALDSTKTNKIIIGAPAANRITITIKGKAAHSGSAPELGVNALAIAADAITRLQLGRIDALSTANFGLIEGGTATNIIPNKVILEGEVRSHSTTLLRQYTDQIRSVFSNVIANWPVEAEQCEPTFTMDEYEDFPLMSLGEHEPVVTHLRQALASTGENPDFDIAGGGSDANIFCGYGIKTAILPTGMKDVHTTDESVDLNDMIRLTELLLSLVS